MLTLNLNSISYSVSEITEESQKKIISSIYQSVTVGITSLDNFSKTFIS